MRVCMGEGVAASVAVAVARPVASDLWLGW